MGAVQAALGLVPDLAVKVIESSCCGMAGAFGYEAAHHDVSMKMAELSLLPAVRAAGPDTLLVADGTSCRHQIKDGAGREAIHVARVLERALGSSRQWREGRRERREDEGRNDSFARYRAHPHPTLSRWGEGQERITPRSWRPASRPSSPTA